MSVVEFIFRKAGEVFNFTKDRLRLLAPPGIWKIWTADISCTPAGSYFCYYVMIRSFLLDTRVFSLHLFRWQHWEIASQRVFNNIALLFMDNIEHFSDKACRINIYIYISYISYIYIYIYILLIYYIFCVVDFLLLEHSKTLKLQHLHMSSLHVNNRRGTGIWRKTLAKVCQRHSLGLIKVSLVKLLAFRNWRRNTYQKV